LVGRNATRPVSVVLGYKADRGNVFFAICMLSNVAGRGLELCAMYYGKPEVKPDNIV
jgi:hypothetical protein